MTVSLLPNLIPEFLIQGVPASGGQLFCYAAGTTSKLATYTDSTGAVAQTNPIVLNARGEPQNTLGASVGLWLTQSAAYKFVLAPSTDTDPPQNPIWTIDNITAGQLTGNSFTSTGTNAIALTAATGTPAPTSYANFGTYIFSAPATSTGPVTIQVGSLGYLPAFVNGVQAGSGSIQAGAVVIAVYSSYLNSGTGGFTLYTNTSASLLLFGTDTGTANQYVVTPTTTVSSLTKGLVVSFVANNANTGATTLNLNSLGAQTVKTTSGAVLTSGMITANQNCLMAWNGTNFQLLNPTTVTGANNLTLYGVDSGTSNTYVLTPSIPVTLTKGTVVDFVALYSNTGASTVNVSGLGVITIKRTDGTDVQTGDIVGGGSYWLCYDGTYWQLMNPTLGLARIRAGAYCTVSGSLTTVNSTNCSVSKTTTGTFAVTFSTGAVPDGNYYAVATLENSTILIIAITSKSSSGFTITTKTSSNVLQDPSGFDFIVVE